MPLDYNNPDGEKINMYWEQFPGSSDVTTPVIFLPGGPLGHAVFHGIENPESNEVLGPYFIKELFNDRNFIMFDYRGFSCSGLIESLTDLKGKEQFYDISSMASDVRSLKEYLYPHRKVAIYGGSYGFVLGARVVNDHPDIVSGAILGWGSMRGEMYHHSLTVIDTEFERMMNKSSDFRENWMKIMNMIDRGELMFTFGNGEQAENVVVTPEIFQVALWFIVGQSAQALLNFPKLLRLFLNGDGDIVELFKSNVLAYLQMIYMHQNDFPIVGDAKYSYSTVVNYYRCNSYATELRTEIKNDPLPLKYLNSNLFVSFWDKTCSRFDQLKLIDTDISNRINRTDVPILAWLGKLDGFNWKTSEEDLNVLSTKADIHVFSDWSHDLGVDGVAGKETMKSLVINFLEKLDRDE